MLRRLLLAGAVSSALSPYWVNYGSLLHFDGANNSTIIADESGKVWTRNGAIISTEQSVFGGSSLKIGTAGHYAETVSHADHNFGREDFTIEAFVRFLVVDTANRIIAAKDHTASTRGWIWLVDGSGLGFHFRDGTTTYSVFSSQTLVANQQYHLVVTRKDGVMRQFVDGVLVGSTTVGTANMNVTTHVTRFGGTANGVGWFTGYIDEFRTVKGQALYTENFTVPTAPFENGRLMILLPFDGPDGSAIIHDEKYRAWTRQGTAQLDTANYKFGGSALLAGNSNWARDNISDINFRTKDFTIDAWVYIVDTSVNVIVAQSSGGASFSINNRKLQFSQAFVAVRITGILDVPLNEWCHVAAVRKAGVLSLYVNGQFDSSVANTNDFNATEIGVAGYQGVPAADTINTHMDEFRAFGGIALYDGSFTPPSKPMAYPTRVYTVEEYNSNVIADYTQYQDGATTWSISSGRLIATSPAGAAQSKLVLNNKQLRDGELEVVFSQAPDSGVVFRLINNSNYYLAAIYDSVGDSGSAVNQVRLYRRLNGGYFQMGSNLPISFPRGELHTLKVVFSGPVFEVWFDGVWLGAVSDTSFTKGMFGLRHGGGVPETRIESLTYLDN